MVRESRARVKPTGSTPGAAEATRFVMAGHKESVFEGKTLDDAVRMGLNALRLSRAEVMITVLEEGSGGFLGLGARPYKVRVMPRPGGPPREPAARGEREDRSRGGRGGRGRRERSGSRGEGRAEPQRASRGEARDGERGREGRGEPQRAGRNESRGGDRERGRDGRGERDRSGREAGLAPAARRDDAGPGQEVPTSGREGHLPTPERPAYAEGDGRRRRRGRRGGRGRGEDRPMVEAEAPPAGAVAVAPEGAAPQFTPGEPSAAMGDIRPPREPRERSRSDERGDRGDRGESRPTGPALPAAELEARATRATEELLRAMGFEGRVSARAEGDNVDVTAEVPVGEDLLTGRKGEVRQALQHLLNLTVNRGEGMRYHLQLEINDFWQRREKELEDLARSMADDAVARGGEVLTEYLNAQERRIIHVTLREDARVKTYAIGDGLIKKLAVAPADHPEASRETD
jgi:predicted RNA-binding protein Jag